jgi:hypothetical protein
MNLLSILTVGDFFQKGKRDHPDLERRVRYVSVTRLRDNVLEGRDEISILLFLEGEVEARFAFHFPEDTVFVVGEKPC